MPVAYGQIDPRDLSIPHLPDRLIGCRIAHVTDVHAWRASHRWTRLAHQLSGLRVDLVIFTGDYGLHLRYDEHAVSALRQITDPLRPTLGCFGVFGNHDSDTLRQLARELPITWLANQTLRLDDAPIDLLGLDHARAGAHDAVELLLQHAPHDDPAPRLRICLSHYPDRIMTAADLGCHLMFSGHTHGGQCRIPGIGPLVNCSDLPLRLTSGILRHRDLLAAISRGCGSGPHPPRAFCPPHLPVYTLRKGPMPGRYTEAIENVQPW